MCASEFYLSFCPTLYHSISLSLRRLKLAIEARSSSWALPSVLGTVLARSQIYPASPTQLLFAKHARHGRGPFDVRRDSSAVHRLPFFGPNTSPHPKPFRTRTYVGSMRSKGGSTTCRRLIVMFDLFSSLALHSFNSLPEFLLYSYSQSFDLKPTQ